MFLKRCQQTRACAALSTHAQFSGRSGNKKDDMRFIRIRLEDCEEDSYACMVRKLQMEESQELQEEGREETRKATVGTRLGLQVILDQHSNLDSIATRFDNDNSFKVHIGQPTAFPMLSRDQLTLAAGKY